MAIVEIVVDSVESAVAALEGGADRLEVCMGLAQGGLFPGAGLIAGIRESVTIPIHVMIRPRAGNFVYSKAEFAAMKDQIIIARESGADGVVFGMLDEKRNVDNRTSELVGFSSPMSVTFHRAFDEAQDPMRALDAIVTSGAHRLLTSGQAATAYQGRELIRTMVGKRGKDIRILAGAGIDETIAATLVNFTGVEEIHAAGSVRDSETGRVLTSRVRSLVNSVRH